MNRKFRLAAVERLRGNRLSETARALAQVRRELAEAGDERARLRAGLLSCLPASPARPDDLRTAGERRNLLRDRIALVDGRIAELEQRADAARARWLTARAELRAVEALHQRHREALRAEDDRRDQRLLDDLAIARYRGGRLTGSAAGSAAGSADPLGGGGGLGGDVA